MLDANSKTDTFLSSIKKYALQQSNQLHDEAEQFREKELQRIKNNANDEAGIMIARETAAIKANIAGEFAQKYDEGRNALFEKRNQLIESVYDAASAKLAEFTKSNDYSEYLMRCADEVLRVIGETDGHKLLIKESDKKFADMLTKALGGNCTVEYSDEIKIGGFILECPSLKIIVDETLDEKLNETREWFMSNSGLKCS